MDADALKRLFETNNLTEEFVGNMLLIIKSNPSWTIEDMSREVEAIIARNKNLHNEIYTKIFLSLLFTLLTSPRVAVFRNENRKVF